MLITSYILVIRTILNVVFSEHNSGQNLSTKPRTPFELIYYEAYKSKKDAMTRERKLKQFKNSYSELKKRIENSL